MTKTAKELIENEVKSVENSISTGRQCGKTYKSGVREGLMIALAHIQNTSTLVTSEETVTINKNVYDLLINKVNKQREQIGLAIEELEEPEEKYRKQMDRFKNSDMNESAQSHCETQLKLLFPAHKAYNKLAEIGGEDEI
ncbi:hypothetical protein VNN37_02380 [Lactococcus garvieae]|uniref:hypothetical protein n=1 Tax=Lactococcus garvieae TaxID=1363 RepID=UPI0030CB7CBE